MNPGEEEYAEDTEIFVARPPRRRRPAGWKTPFELRIAGACDTEKADHHGVQPEKQQHREQAPVEVQHPRKRDEVRREQRQRGGLLPPCSVLAGVERRIDGEPPVGSDAGILEPWVRARIAG